MNSLVYRLIIRGSNHFTIPSSFVRPPIPFILTLRPFFPPLVLPVISSFTPYIPLQVSFTNECFDLIFSFLH